MRAGRIQMWVAGVATATLGAGAMADDASRYFGWTPLNYVETSADQFPADLKARVVVSAGEEYTDNPGYFMRTNFDYVHYFPIGGGQGLILMNHELLDSDPSEDFPTPGMENQSGGMSRIVVNRKNKRISTNLHEWQTSVNCSGGGTPWGTVLTHEEFPGGAIDTPDDGYVWEVNPLQTNSKHRVDAMGRFSHEGSAFDAAGNFVSVRRTACRSW